METSCGTQAFIAAIDSMNGLLTVACRTWID
jgi:hypothetical protein